MIEGHDASVPTTITLDNVQVDGIKSSDLTESYVNYTLGPDPVNFASLIKGTGVTVTNNVSTVESAVQLSRVGFLSDRRRADSRGLAGFRRDRRSSVAVQVITTKAVPYQTYLTNLKSNPNATLAHCLRPPARSPFLTAGRRLGWARSMALPMLSIPVAGLGNGPHVLTATYSGDSNYASISFGNYPLNVGSAASGTPAIFAGAVVNAASFASSSIAQGSLFSIFGTNLGPIAPVQAAVFRCLAMLGGSSVQITQGGVEYDASVLFASSGQVNAILPSNVPIGIAQVTVTS